MIENDSSTREAFQEEVIELASDAYALWINTLQLYGGASQICIDMSKIAIALRKLANDVEELSKQEQP